MLINESEKIITFFPVSKKKLSQQVIIPKIGVQRGGGGPTVVSPFYAKKMAMNFGFVIILTLMFIYRVFIERFYVLSYSVKLWYYKLQHVKL